LIDNQVAFPAEGCPTTHILKPEPLYYPGLVQNEYFCLQLARSIGLPAVHAMIRKAQDTIYLLIERYDRAIENNHIRRIHQEDFCQALGIVSINKYQNEGGPGFDACFDLLNRTTYPAQDRNVLAEIAVFNYLIGNMDAHGKNFSLLHANNTVLKLASFYDLVSTRVYADLTTKMAMKIGSQYQADSVLQSHWQNLCEKCSYRWPALQEIMHRQCVVILPAAQQIAEQIQQAGWQHAIVADIIKVIEKNVQRVLRMLTP